MCVWGHFCRRLFIHPTEQYNMLYRNVWSYPIWWAHFNTCWCFLCNQCVMNPMILIFLSRSWKYIYKIRSKQTRTLYRICMQKIRSKNEQMTELCQIAESIETLTVFCYFDFFQLRHSDFFCHSYVITEEQSKK